MSEIMSNGQRFEIVTFAEALKRLGMFGKVHDAEQFHDEQVAYAPSVSANPRTGQLFSILSGRVLYSFNVVRKADHLPDEPWAWNSTNRSICIVVECTSESVCGNPDMRLSACTPSI